MIKEPLRTNDKLPGSNHVQSPHIYSLSERHKTMDYNYVYICTSTVMIHRWQRYLSDCDATGGKLYRSLLFPWITLRQLLLPHLYTAQATLCGNSSLRSHLSLASNRGSVTISHLPFVVAKIPGS